MEVKVTEGPMSFARHVVGFTAWGTAVRLVAEAHQFVRPELVLPLDDAVVTFEAESLRGRGREEAPVSARAGLGRMGPYLRVGARARRVRGALRSRRPSSATR